MIYRILVYIKENLLNKVLNKINLVNKVIKKMIKTIRIENENLIIIKIIRLTFLIIIIRSIIPKCKVKSGEGLNCN